MDHPQPSRPKPWYEQADELDAKLYIVNPDGVILFVNKENDPAVYSRLIGSHVLDHLGPEHRDLFPQALAAVVQYNRFKEYEVAGIGVDRQAGWSQVRIHPIMRNGKTDLISILLVDVSAQKRMVEKLLMLEEDLTVSLNLVDEPEEIVTMCAWTKKFFLDGHWVPVEDFLLKRFGIRVSHGLSDPDLFGPHGNRQDA